MPGSWRKGASAVWIPKSADEVEARAAAGDLSETAVFEGKRELPPPHKTIELAIDVAALAGDGGIMIFGLGEDEHKRLTILAPFALAGVRERIDSIVRSCIAEPPTIEIVSLPTAGDATIGYIAVVVPPSPRAPHMVVKNGDMRYYGRGPVGNVRLSEGDVARLYQRRQRWEADQEAIIDHAVARSPLSPTEGYGFLYLGVRPVVPDEGLLDRAIERFGPDERRQRHPLSRFLAEACGPEVFPTGRMYLDMDAGMVWRRQAEGYRVSFGLEPGEQVVPQRLLTFAVDDDGGGHLFHGRATATRDGTPFIFEDVAVGLTTRLLRLLGGVYEAAGYMGPLDVGLLVTGLRGGVSDWLVHRTSLGAHFYSTPALYDQDEYRRTRRFAALDLLRDPQQAARSLTERLYRTTTGERYDPFATR